MNTDEILGLVRHALTTLGGALVARGYLDDGTAQAATGVLMALGGVAWSIYAKRTAPVITTLPGGTRGFDGPLTVLLLAAGLALGACSTTAPSHAQQVAMARQVAALTEAAATAYVVSQGGNPALLAEVSAGTVALNAALDAWAAAPADDARAQAAGAALAGLTAALAEIKAPPG